MNKWQWFRIAVGAVIFLLVFAGAGATIIGSCVHEIIETRQWMQTSVATSAIVEERHRHGDADEYEATVLFSPVEGDEVSAKVVGTDLGEPGSVLDIRYDPEEPTSARLSPSLPFWLGPAFGILFGSLFLAIPLLVIVGGIVDGLRGGSRAVNARFAEVER